MLALTLALAVASPAAASTYSVDAGPCRYIHWKQGVQQVKRLIRCVEDRWSVPGGARKALDVARCESGFNPKARTGSFVGLYQHGLRWWPSRWRKYAEPLGLPYNPYNARTNAVVSMRIAHRLGSWSIWTCG